MKIFQIWSDIFSEKIQLKILKHSEHMHVTEDHGEPFWNFNCTNDCKDICTKIKNFDKI